MGLGTSRFGGFLAGLERRRAGQDEDETGQNVSPLECHRDG